MKICDCGMEYKDDDNLNGGYCNSCLSDIERETKEEFSKKGIYY